jgi:hypothetical protein
LAKSRRSKSVSNKSIKQSKKSARGLVGKKGQDRRAPAGSRRLGGGGPNPHPPEKNYDAHSNTRTAASSRLARRMEFERNWQHIQA